MTKDQLNQLADEAAQDCVEALPNKLIELLGKNTEASETLAYLMNDISQAIIETFQDKVINPTDLVA